MEVDGESVGEDADGNGYETQHALAVTKCDDPKGNISSIMGGAADWVPLEVLVDNCADERVCGADDFYWVGIQPSTASGQKISPSGRGRSR